jgi:hypothetical protein
LSSDEHSSSAGNKHVRLLNADDDGASSDCSGLTTSDVDDDHDDDDDVDDDNDDHHHHHHSNNNHNHNHNNNNDDDDDEDDFGTESEDNDFNSQYNPNSINNNAHGNNNNNSNNKYSRSSGGLIHSYNHHGLGNHELHEIMHRKKKTRTVFSRTQIFQLETTFDRKRYLSSADRANLAQGLRLTEQQVKVNNFDACFAFLDICSSFSWLFLHVFIACLDMVSKSSK